MNILEITKAPLATIEKSIIESRIQEYAYNLQAAAKSLGISRSTIYRKVKLYKIYVRQVVDDSSNERGEQNG